MESQHSRMFEYCIMILKKLSFCPRLFRREYRKSFRFLPREEHSAFRNRTRLIVQASRLDANVTSVRDVFD